MEITTYNEALKIYIEVLTNLIENNLSLFDEEHNKIKITITESGFQKEIIQRNQSLNISVTEVLKLLAVNIDYLLTKYQINITPYPKYANLPDIKKTITKKYYNSYQEIDIIFKKITMLNEANKYNNNPKITYYKQIEENKLPRKFENYTNLELKTIECYSLLEQEFINKTKDLLWDLEKQNNEQYIEWKDFQNCILHNTSNKVK